jgi:hypothetical protein
MDNAATPDNNHLLVDNYLLVKEDFTERSPTAFVTIDKNLIVQEDLIAWPSTAARCSAWGLGFGVWGLGFSLGNRVALNRCEMQRTAAVVVLRIHRRALTHEVLKGLEVAGSGCLAHLLAVGEHKLR